MTQNYLNFCSEEKSYIDSLESKMLNTSLKNNDDHTIFGAYVAMEMRNLKTSTAQIKLRGEIRDAISRVVLEECAAEVNDSSDFKLNEKDNNAQEINDANGSSANCIRTDHEKRIRSPSWELIN